MGKVLYLPRREGPARIESGRVIYFPGDGRANDNEYTELSGVSELFYSRPKVREPLTDIGVRLRRIKESLERINVLMGELKKADRQRDIDNFTE